jgi:hypothetical protein
VIAASRWPKAAARQRSVRSAAAAVALHARLDLILVEATNAREADMADAAMGVVKARLKLAGCRGCFSNSEAGHDGLIVRGIKSACDGLPGRRRPGPQQGGRRALAGERPAALHSPPELPRDGDCFDRLHHESPSRGEV